LLITTIIYQPLKLIAEDVIPEEFISKKELTKAELLDKVYNYADSYNVSAKTMISVINCENKEWDTNLQSRIINKRGQREESYGLSQIHLPSHPSITLEEATDPDFSIKFMAEKLSQKKGNMWTCYRKLNS
jgi:hypothetical protein